MVDETTSLSSRRADGQPSIQQFPRETELIQKVD